LDRNPKEIFEEKVLLVYEHDKRSPLFVRTAYIEIENNNVEKAITILHSGLKIYPNYPTALFLLGRALAIIGQYDEALETFQTASDLINSNDSLIYYKSEVERIKQQRTPFEFRRKTTLIEEPSIEEVKSGMKALHTQRDDSAIGDIIDKSSDEKISRIAKQTAELNDNLPQKNEESLIISDTFANILVSQERYDEAIHVYKELIRKNPDKSQLYIDKINTLSEKKNN